MIFYEAYTTDGPRRFNSEHEVYSALGPQASWRLVVDEHPSIEEMFSNAMEWIFEHIHQEDIRTMMERVGYTDEEIDQYYEEFMQ